MSWTRNEVWFDMDVLWFREQPTGPFSVLAFELPAFARDPDLATPIETGLEASRQRRLQAQAARKRRLATRTVPAVALVLARRRCCRSPPSVTAARGGRPARCRRIRRASRSGSTSAGSSSRSAVPPSGAPARKPAARKLAHVKELRRVEWHRAVSAGLPYSGRLRRRHAASRRGARLGHVEPGHGQRPEPAAPALRQRANDPRRSSR